MSRDCNPGIPNHGIPDRFSIPKFRDFARPNPGISGLEFPVMSCVEKHALLLKYKLYVNAVVAELAGLKAALISTESLYNWVLTAQTETSQIPGQSDLRLPTASAQAARPKA